MRLPKLKRLLKAHPTPWRTGHPSDDHWRRDVRDANGRGVAWCGGPDGGDVAAAIVEAVNAAAETVAATKPRGKAKS